MFTFVYNNFSALTYVAFTAMCLMVHITPNSPNRLLVLRPSLPSITEAARNS